MTTDSVVEEEDSEPSTDDEPEEQEKEVSKEPEPAEHKVPRGVQKKIDKLTRRNYEKDNKLRALEKRLQELESAKQPKPEEEVEDEYVTVSTLKKVIKEELSEGLSIKEQVDAQRKMQEHVDEVFSKGREEYDDFDEVALSVDYPDVLGEIVLDSDLAHKVAYHLGTNLDELDRISRLTPNAMARAVGRIEAEIESKSNSNSKTKSKTKKVTNASPPIKPVSDKETAPDLSLEDMSQADYNRIRNKQERESGDY